MPESENAEIIAMLDSARMGNNFAVVAAGLMMYDFMITFGKEVGLFWRFKKFTLSSILFLVNRYLPLVVSMCFAPWPSIPATFMTLAIRKIPSQVFQYFPWADASPMDFSQRTFMTTLTAAFIWLAFSGLRTYALSPRAWPLAVLVFVLSLGPFVINYVALGYVVPYLDPIYGCGATSTLTSAAQQDFTILARACLIAADLLVLAMTWTATYRNSRELELLGQSTSISGILFRDGVIYFAVLLIMNVLHLSFSLYSTMHTQVLDPHNTTNHASYIARLTETMTAVLISRFLIDLQEGNNGKYLPHSLSSIQISSLDFNRVVGSLSSSLAASGEESSELGGQHRLDSGECADEENDRTWSQMTQQG